MNPCIHCLVEGRVQGVFFRDSTRRKALALGLNGWVRNLEDGRVEVLACGPRTELDRLSEWLRVGPAHARVTRVSCDRTAEAACEDFTIR